MVSVTSEVTASASYQSTPPKPALPDPTQLSSSFASMVDNSLPPSDPTAALPPAPDQPAPPRPSRDVSKASDNAPPRNTQNTNQDPPPSRADNSSSTDDQPPPAATADAKPSTDAPKKSDSHQVHRPRKPTAPNRPTRPPTDATKVTDATDADADRAASDKIAVTPDPIAALIQAPVACRPPRRRRRPAIPTRRSPSQPPRSPPPIDHGVADRRARARQDRYAGGKGRNRGREREGSSPGCCDRSRGCAASRRDRSGRCHRCRPARRRRHAGRDEGQHHRPEDHRDHADQGRSDAGFRQDEAATDAPALTATTDAAKTGAAPQPTTEAKPNTTLTDAIKPDGNGAAHAGSRLPRSSGRRRQCPGADEFRRRRRAASCRAAAAGFQHRAVAATDKFTVTQATGAPVPVSGLAVEIAANVTRRQDPLRCPARSRRSRPHRRAHRCRSQRPGDLASDRREAGDAVDAAAGRAATAAGAERCRPEDRQRRPAIQPARPVAVGPEQQRQTRAAISRSGWWSPKKTPCPPPMAGRSYGRMFGANGGVDIRV